MYIPTKLHRNILSHTVYLLNKANKEIIIGSAVLIEYKGSPYIITALHNLAGATNDKIFIHLGINDFKYTIKKEETFKYEELDLALIRLNNFEVEILKGIHIEPFIIKKRNIVDIPRQKLKCAISGFPSSMTKKEKNLIIAETYFITTHPLYPEEWPQSIIDDGKAPEFNILLKYGSKSNSIFLDQEKNVLNKLIPPQGMSGGAIWVYDPKTEDYNCPKYALLGIQTGIYGKRDLLVGSLVDPLLKKYLGGRPL